MSLDKVKSKLEKETMGHMETQQQLAELHAQMGDLRARVSCVFHGPSYAPPAGWPQLPLQMTLVRSKEKNILSVMTTCKFVNINTTNLQCFHECFNPHFSTDVEIL